MRIQPVFLIFAFIMAGFAVYGSGLAIPHYGDDFAVILDSPASKIFSFFYNAHPSGWYRPTEASFHAASQTLFGPSTAPIHVASILSHALLAWLVYSFMMRLGFRKPQALLGASFMLVSQANVHPVLSNDTLAQVWSALFGFLSVWLLSRPSRLSYALSVLAFAFALFSKEAALPFLIILFGFIVFKKFSEAPENSSSPTRRVTETLLRLMPYVLVTILYLLVRSFFTNEQPSFGPDKYQLNLGLNIVENSARFLFAAFVPTSSVSAFVALQSSAWLAFGAIAGITAVVLTLTVWGAQHSEKRGVMYLMGASSLAAFFPMAALNHVSELHVYDAMPFISVIVGAGLGRLWEMSGTSRTRRALLATGIGLLLTSNVYAVQAKASLMKQNGARATDLLQQLKSRALDVPVGGELVLVNPEKPKVEYSVFLMRGFNVLETPAEIKRLVKRNDIAVTIVEAPELERMQPKKSSVVLTTDEEGRVRAVEP